MPENIASFQPASNSGSLKTSAKDPSNLLIDEITRENNKTHDTASRRDWYPVERREREAVRSLCAVDLSVERS
jgi:hypothetical protein